MNNLDLNNLHQKVNSLIKPASRIASDYFSKNIHTNYKKVNIDKQLSISVVTEADKKVEDFLKNNLKKLYPEFGFIGEESEKANIKEYNWIVDPIDGTLNFIWGVPAYCHSIALWKKDEPIYACVYLPFVKKTIYAIKNKGLFLNGVKVNRRSHKKIDPHILYALVGSPEEKQKIICKAASVISSFRHFGSVVYHGVLVSLGESEIMLSIKTGLWDLAAIVLFGQEAGLNIKWISKKPSIYDKNLKAYKHSFVMGEEKLTSKLIIALKNIK